MTFETLVVFWFWKKVSLVYSGEKNDLQLEKDLILAIIIESIVLLFFY